MTKLAQPDHYSREDAPCLKLLLEAGAIPLVKANTSQCSALVHSKSAVYGDALNPLNFKRVCSGDAGTVAAKCTPFTLSVDYGFCGQLKACFTGVFSLTPSRGRFS